MGDCVCVCVCERARALSGEMVTAFLLREMTSLVCAC